MFLVSDLRNGEYVISGKFYGRNAEARAKAWANEDSLVTGLRSEARFNALHTGQKLPSRYIKK